MRTGTTDTGSRGQRKERSLPVDERLVAEWRDPVVTARYRVPSAGPVSGRKEATTMNSSFRPREEANMCIFGATQPSTKRTEAQAVHRDTPPELIFPPQYPFSWTLRGARAQRLRDKTAPAITPYRIAGSARDPNEVAAAVAFCEAHNAQLELR